MPPLKKVLFPEPPRDSPGQRWANIVLRSLHLIGVAGIAGHFLAAEGVGGKPFWYLTVATGVGLMLLYLFSTLAWLGQLKGGAVLVKLLLLTAALYWPHWQAALFIAVIALSSVVAHAPGKVRGFVWLRAPRRR